MVSIIGSNFNISGGVLCFINTVKIQVHKSGNTHFMSIFSIGDDLICLDISTPSNGVRTLFFTHVNKSMFSASLFLREPSLQKSSVRVS